MLYTWSLSVLLCLLSSFGAARLNLLSDWLLILLGCSP